MRFATLTIAALLVLAAPLTAAERSFEVLLARPFPGDSTQFRYLVILDGGYVNGLDEGMTAKVLHLPGRTEVADLSVEEAGRYESICLALPRGGVSPDTLAGACREHCLIAFDIAEEDTTVLQQRAVAAMGVADFEQAQYFLQELVNQGFDKPSVHSALERCQKQLDAAQQAGLPPEMLQVEKDRLPLYEYLLAHYFGECRFTRAAHLANHIERISPGHAGAAVYKRALTYINTALADGGEDSFPGKGPGPVRVEDPLLVKPAELTLPDSLKNPKTPLKATIGVLVDETGHAAKAVMRKSSGNVHIDDAVMNAAYKTVWRPAVQASMPSAAWGTWEVEVSRQKAKETGIPVQLDTPSSPGELGSTITNPPEMVGEYRPSFDKGYVTAANPRSKVMVKALIDERGRATEVQIKESSGDQYMDEVALKAAEKCRFKPALAEGKPVKVWVSWYFDFSDK